MTDHEESVFRAVRDAVAALPTKSPLPDYDDAVCVARPRLQGASSWDDFATNFSAVNGRPMTAIAELLAFLEAGGFRHGYCDPRFRMALGEPLAAAGLTVEFAFERDRYDDYAFGITRATGAIAESGTVILDDDDTTDRLAALCPWVHVAVLDRPDRLHRTIPEALAALGDCPNVVWATGPSKTADVEGILIEGVHGPGQQICLRL
ncbi:hypothetical protein BH23VER1_BH23VER1_35200 [soil metagenome]